MIIAIDGPAGSGKSTICKQIAEELGVMYLDTGAMYRAMTWGVLQQGIDLADSAAIEAYARSARIDFRLRDKHQEVFLNDLSVEEQIRTPELTRAVKYIARLTPVRRRLVALQQEIGQRADIVVEGRDTTTVVFPEATLKIYLTASPEERARRRFVQLSEQGMSVTYEEILKDQYERDKSDMERLEGPLCKAPDAYELDNTGMSIAETVGVILGLLKKKNSLDFRRITAKKST